MKKIGKIVLAGAAAVALSLASCSRSDGDNRLVILHTNDTHSQILPVDTDGLGGVMRRKAVIDSVRDAEKNVLLVDAGDAVQGTLFFHLYGGQVEQEVMNLLGYDMRILGNHEFDNGVDSLATMLRKFKGQMISSNYDLDDTPLEDIFVPYVIKEYGGHKIGFIGINLDPEGLVAKGRAEGVEYLPAVAQANIMADMLRSDKGVEAVVALTHIGYNPPSAIGDSVLALNSRGIDVIIGGHTHDAIDPTTERGARRSRMTNRDGHPVLVAQAGKSGRYVGKIVLNLDSLGKAAPDYELIKIDGNYDSYADADMQALIDRYAPGLDSLMNEWVGVTTHAIEDKAPELVNYFTDFVYNQGRELAPNVDLAIANKGGLRVPLPEGRISRGTILSLLPFSNYVTVVDLEGDELAELFDIMAASYGNGVSANVAVRYVKDDNGARATSVLIDGRPIDPDRTYRVATIDYLAKGGDYMKPFTEGDVVATSELPVADLLLLHLAIDPSPIGEDATMRWTKE